MGGGLLRQRRTGVTTIYVTHDPVEAMTLGSRIAVLKGGVVQQLATPLDLYERPANLFVADFVGLPSINTLKAMVDAGGVLRLPNGHPVHWGHASRGTVAAKEVIVGARPEDFELRDDGDASGDSGDAPAGPRWSWVPPCGGPFRRRRCTCSTPRAAFD